jgi:hypothetical protein
MMLLFLDQLGPCKIVSRSGLRVVQVHWLGHAFPIAVGHGRCDRVHELIRAQVGGLGGACVVPKHQPRKVPIPSQLTALCRTQLAQARLMVPTQRSARPSALRVIS